MVVCSDRKRGLRACGLPRHGEHGRAGMPRHGGRGGAEDGDVADELVLGADDDEVVFAAILGGEDFSRWIVVLDFTLRRSWFARRRE